MNTSNPKEVGKLIDNLFRKEAGQIVATLTRFLGVSHIDLAENAVQDALLKAMQTWPLSGIPENPSAWLVTSAKNSAIDQLRKSSLFKAKQDGIIQSFSDLGGPNTGGSTRFSTELEDDQLRMLFTCCHPILSPAAQIALTLKVLCGFSVGEISRACLVDTKTIEQRIVRAKSKIKEKNINYEIPTGEEVANRLDVVLSVLYALFNEGYSSSEADKLIKNNLCLEAIRLTKILAKNKSAADSPKVYALLSIMCFQASRLNSRIDAKGHIVLLEDQVRDKWDTSLIGEGLTYLQQAGRGDELSRYHIEAGIAACHSTAVSFEKTNWKLIHRYYGDLMNLCPSPVVAINKAIALAMCSSVKKGLDELLKLEAIEQLSTYHLYPAAIADLYRRLGKTKMAARYYKNALALTRNPIEQNFLTKRLKEINNV